MEGSDEAVGLDDEEEFESCAGLSVGLGEAEGDGAGVAEGSGEADGVTEGDGDEDGEEDELWTCDLEPSCEWAANATPGNATRQSSVPPSSRPEAILCTVICYYLSPFIVSNLKRTSYLMSI